MSTETRKTALRAVAALSALLADADGLWPEDQRALEQALAVAQRLAQARR